MSLDEGRHEHLPYPFSGGGDISPRDWLFKILQMIMNYCTHHTGLRSVTPTASRRHTLRPYGTLIKIIAPGRLASSLSVSRASGLTQSHVTRMKKKEFWLFTAKLPRGYEGHMIQNVGQCRSHRVQHEYHRPWIIEYSARASASTRRIDQGSRGGVTARGGQISHRSHMAHGSQQRKSGSLLDSTP